MIVIITLVLLTESNTTEDDYLFILYSASFFWLRPSVLVTGFLLFLSFLICLILQELIQGLACVA